MTEYLIIYILLCISIVANKKIILIPTLFYMLIIGCLRGESVGTDIGTYYNNFVYSRFDPKSWDAGTYFEIGFTYILLFIKYYISKDYMTYISILFLYTFGITTWFFYKYSKYKALSFFALYTFGMYFFFMNGMRQAFAFATCLLVLNYYIKTKNIYIFLIEIILITILLHNSCIIFCIVPFLRKIADKIKLTKTHIYIAIAISLIFATVLQGTLMNILGVLAPILGRFSTYIINAEQQGIFMTLFITAACIITVYFTKDIKNTFFLAYVFGTICYNLLASFSPTAPRMALHLTFLSGICYSFTYIQLKKNKQRVYLATIIILATINFTYATLIKGYEGVRPYVFRKDIISINDIPPSFSDNIYTIKIKS